MIEVDADCVIVLTDAMHKTVKKACYFRNTASFFLLRSTQLSSTA